MKADTHKNSEWLATGCAGCTSWCAVEALVENNKVVRVRGNAKSKVNKGRVCPRAHLGLQQAYDPDRITVPLKRTNPNKSRDEDPQFIPISWDKAMDDIAEKIMELRENNEPHKFALLRGRYTDLSELLYENLPKLIGSPNNISHSSICAEAEKFGPYFTEGYWDYRDYDIANTRFVLCWGADPISTNRQVAHYQSSWGKLLDSATVVTVDARLTATASKSHLWLPVKTGQDGAIAMAIAHVILTEGLWSKEFVGDFIDGKNRFISGRLVEEDTFREKHTNGVVRWWNLELKDKFPLWAEQISGAAAKDIVWVAKEFAKAAPRAMVFMGGGAVMQARGAYNSMAIHALNGLVGSVDMMGGTMRGAYVPEQNLPSCDSYIDAIAAAGRKYPKIDQSGTLTFPALKKGKSGGGVVTNRVADAIIDANPYDLKVVFGYWNNFAYSAPETKRWEEALAKIPFFVHCVTNISEMSHFADIILPATFHMFEQWGYHTQKANGYTHLRCLQPVITPPGECKNPEAQVVWLLGEKLAAKGFPNLLDYLKIIVDPETQKEPSSGDELEYNLMKHKLQPIYDPAQYHSGEKFNGWEDFITQGGVWNSDKYQYQRTWDNFGTVTGKFEFYSETLKKALQAHAARHNTTVNDVMDACGYLAREEQAFIPHYEEPLVAGDVKEYPILFVDHKSRLNREGRAANCTWYQEHRNIEPGEVSWGDTVKLNPIDADKLGINQDDMLKVISPAGELIVQAAVWEGIVPGTVAKSYGQGHWAYGRVASLDFAKRIPRGGNNNTIIPASYERLSGASGYYAATRVRLEKISDEQSDKRGGADD